MEAHRLHYHYATTGNINMSMASGSGVKNANNKAGGSKAATKADYAAIPKVNDQGLRGGKQEVSRGNPR